MDYSTPGFPVLHYLQGVCSNSCSVKLVMLSISSSAAPFSFCLQFFPASGPFPMTLRIRWPKYWNFSFNNSPSIEYSRLISFWMDWFDIPSPHPKYHLQLGQKKMLGVVVWDCKGEENNSHGDGKANVWDNGRQSFGLWFRSCWASPTYQACILCRCLWW